jgi:hypothetical protein
MAEIGLPLPPRHKRETQYISAIMKIYVHSAIINNMQCLGWKVFSLEESLPRSQ